MIATAWGVWYAGHTPVFVDCLDNMNINPDLIESKITSKTVAILITHVYGRICLMEPILALCKKYNLDLIEDCAEVHGATYVDGPRKNKYVGSLGIGCFSFYKNKIVAAEEGGAVTVPNDSKYALLLRDLKNMSFGKYHNYIHDHIGFNYRMSDSQAQIALQSLDKINKNLIKRQIIESWYDKNLKSSFIRPKRDVVWIYDINCKNPKSLVEYLNDNAIAARRCFAPMSIQPCFNLTIDFRKLKSYDLYNTTCYLPVNPLMIESDVIDICSKVNNFTEN